MTTRSRRMLRPHLKWARSFADTLSVARLLAYLARWLRRPLYLPELPVPLPITLVYAGLTAMGLLLASVVAVAGPGALDLLTVLAYVGLCSATGLLKVWMGNTAYLSGGDMFLSIVVVAAAPRAAAAVILITTVVRVIECRTSILHGLSISVSLLLGGLTGLGAVAVIGAADLPYGLDTVAMVATCFVALRAWETLLYGACVLAYLHSQSGRELPRDDIMAELRQSIRQDGLQLLFQVPVAVAGVMAFRSAWWSPILLMAPFLGTFYTARAVARVEELERQEGVDVLTQLPNRKRFWADADREISNALAYGHSVALIMGDLDNFKAVNDGLGHLTGDDVLRRTASVMRSISNRERLPCARYGGEEFVLIVPTRSDERLVQLAEEIRTRVEAALKPFGTTISLGIYQRVQDSRLEPMIDRADKALYAAKGAGKNRTYVWLHDEAIPCSDVTSHLATEDAA